MFAHSECLFGAEPFVEAAVLEAGLSNGERRELCVSVLDSQTGLDPAIFDGSEFSTTYQVAAVKAASIFHIELLGVSQELVERTM